MTTTPKSKNGILKVIAIALTAIFTVSGSYWTLQVVNAKRIEKAADVGNENRGEIQVLKNEDKHLNKGIFRIEESQKVMHGKLDKLLSQ